MDEGRIRGRGEASGEERGVDRLCDECFESGGGGKRERGQEV